MDDIAGLIERLRAPNAAYTRATDGDPNMSRYISWLKGLGEEAATQLAALSARVEELEAECADLERAGVAMVDKVIAHGDRALRAEQELDEAYERAAKVADDLAAKRRKAESKLGYGPGAATPAANAYWCEEIGEAIRRLAGKQD